MDQKTLHKKQDQLAGSEYQLKVLNDDEKTGKKLTRFSEKLSDIQLFPLKPVALDIFQVNMGKMCNQVCQHCHVDAGPDRKEIMTRDIMQTCIDLIGQHQFTTIDLTGGAPELNPNFRWFVEEIRKVNPTCKIIVRCNLTIIVANKRYYDLPEFYKANRIEVVSSLPFYSASRTDKQRGDGVFEDSIKALGMLNEVGYGIENSGLILNLVYNPAGAFLPPDQNSLEKEYKTELKNKYGITFNNLFAITNMPVSRYLNYLLQSGNYASYMEKLISAFNPVAASNVMCRNTLSIGWNGYIYDCDFNQMLDLKVEAKDSQHINNFNNESLKKRNIIVNQHCYGCTAGAGSSCGGEVAS
ncbi:MAG: arsenosugar biosynthesis radical SAM protein ArsS [Bacteroidota bacterium]|nr:arsenosugar biosynthesis radical SAM protein ArsS [Bacteroidota bacterium]